ncbi:MAG: hypothetical protein QM751_01060 [Paludibacteraceae bacterium]
MLEGLEIKEILLSEPFNTELLRLESEFYTAKTFTLNKSYSGLDVIDFVQYGTSDELNEEKEGYPVLRLNEFQSNFIGTPSKYCKLMDKSTYESLRLRKNDVLICRTNGNPKLVGKAAIVQKDSEFAYASYLFKIRPKKELINASTLVTFLNSKYGRLEIEKFSMASNQVNFSPAKFREMRIPNFNSGFNDKLESLTFESYDLLDKSQILYLQAETLLLETLGLNNFEPTTEAVNVKSFKESFLSSDRLDAEYYQKKYEYYETVIKTNELGFTYITNEYSLIKNVSKKDKESYNYIEIGNVNVSDGSAICNLLDSSKLPANAKTEVEKGDILISKVRSNRGAVTIIDFEVENLIVSGAFTVLREKANSFFSNETLKVLLRTPMYKDWLLQFNIGTQYPVIRDEDILKNAYS